MERGLMMLMHSLIIGVLLYIFMIYIFNQKPLIAENRSILISSFLLAYMILFGHGLPTKINKTIF